jgi:hypothetical protein
VGGVFSPRLLVNHLGRIEPNRTLCSYPSAAKPHAQHGSKPARTPRQQNHTLGAPSFSPYHASRLIALSPVRPFAYAPIRLHLRPFHPGEFRGCG